MIQSPSFLKKLTPKSVPRWYPKQDKRIWCMAEVVGLKGLAKSTTYTLRKNFLWFAYAQVPKAKKTDGSVGAKVIRNIEISFL